MPSDIYTHAVGHVVADAEHKAIGNGEVCKFRLAVNQWKDTDPAIFLDVDLWGSRAQRLAQIITKGMAVNVRGRLEMREYEKDGVTRQAYQIRADEIQFLGEKPSGGGKSKQAPAQPVGGGSPVTDDEIQFHPNRGDQWA